MAASSSVSDPSLSPQCRTVLRYLRDRGSLTARTALLDLRIPRLASRISELKAAGFDIEAKSELNRVTGDRYARYTLNEEKSE